MVRPTVLKEGRGYNIVLEADVIRALERIATREQKSVSELLRPVISKYTKAHGRGNDQMPLDLSIADPGFVALPTIGEVITPDRLDAMSDPDLSVLEAASTARAQEIAAAAKRRHLREWGTRP